MLKLFPTDMTTCKKDANKNVSIFRLNFGASQDLAVCEPKRPTFSSFLLFIETQITSTAQFPLINTSGLEEIYFLQCCCQQLSSVKTNALISSSCLWTMYGTECAAYLKHCSSQPKHNLSHKWETRRHFEAFNFYGRRHQMEAFQSHLTPSWAVSSVFQCIRIRVDYIKGELQSMECNPEIYSKVSLVLNIPKIDWIFHHYFCSFSVSDNLDTVCSCVVHFVVSRLDFSL